TFSGWPVVARNYKFVHEGDLKKQSSELSYSASFAVLRFRLSTQVKAQWGYNPSPTYGIDGPARRPSQVNRNPANGLFRRTGRGLRLSRSLAFRQRRGRE